MGKKLSMPFFGSVMFSIQELLLINNLIKDKQYEMLRCPNFIEIKQEYSDLVNISEKISNSIIRESIPIIEIKKLLESGKKIEAVKLVKTFLKCTLFQAKLIVDKL